MSGSGERRPVPRLGAGLEFVDPGGVHWQVTEHDGRGVPGSRGERCLIFSSADVIRRVWEYPSGWRDLLPASLTALSWHR